MLKEQWQNDLDWLLTNPFAGHGGKKRLAAALSIYSACVTPGILYHWGYGLRRPNAENQRALRLLREAHEGANPKGGE